MAITFSVCDEVGSKPMPVLERDKAIASILGESRRLEQRWKSELPLVAATDVNALAQAAHDAFYMHHPLVLSPDAVWFTLVQGFATHVARNAESLRHRFVQHEGKKKLLVQRPDFFLGKENPWPEVFTAFGEQIAAHVGKMRDLVVADFSTTGPIERAASDVALMDTFQAYFEYEMLAGCGIPSFTLLGTPEDWQSVRRRAAMLSELGLTWWTDALLPVLDELVRSSEGKPDKGFWRSFFRYQSGSGPAELTGWILTLFPYIDVLGKDHAVVVDANPYLSTWERAFRAAEARNSWIQTPEGPWISALPTSLAGAPVRFVDARDGSEHPIRFVGGMFGVTQDPRTLAVAPEFGWAIVHESSASNASPR